MSTLSILHQIVTPQMNFPKERAMRNEYSSLDQIVNIKKTDHESKKCGSRETIISMNIYVT